jgi:hypothetical protein
VANGVFGYFCKKFTAAANFFRLAKLRCRDRPAFLRDAESRDNVKLKTKGEACVTKADRQVHLVGSNTRFTNCLRSCEDSAVHEAKSICQISSRKGGACISLLAKMTNVILAFLIWHLIVKHSETKTCAQGRVCSSIWHQRCFSRQQTALTTGYETD